MNIIDKWSEIKQLFESAGRSSLYCAVASVDANGYPHVTPIGSLTLRDDCTGYYFEEFPLQLPKNLDECKKVSVLVVNSDPKFWMEALAGGKFNTYPGMRLTGTVSGKRPANEAERTAIQEKFRFAEGLKGHEILWKNMQTVRDIQFDACKPVVCGDMTAHLS